MKVLNSILGLVATTALATESIQWVILDDRAVIVVPVATNRVTTISFPSPIAAIDAAGISADPKAPGLFQLAHTKGSSFLSVRAGVPAAAANLNVRWNKRTYVFELIESKAPVLALNLEERPALPITREGSPVSPTRLLALLDKAKAFPLFKQQHPEAVGQAEARTFAADKSPVTDFTDYEIRTQEVFRFNPEDTLVFHITLRNRSEREIRYLPGSFVIRAGDRLYYQSISDASGVLPPKSERAVYFAVTGTSDGGRNELSLKNDFTVLVTRQTPEPPLPAPTAEPLPTYPEEHQP